jgi:hypothetical protein
LISVSSQRFLVSNAGSDLYAQGAATVCSPPGCGTP